VILFLKNCTRLGTKKYLNPGGGSKNESKTGEEKIGRLKTLKFQF